MDKKKQFNENGHTTQNNLWIQCYPIKLPLTFSTELEENCFKFHMEPKKSPYSQDNSEQKEPNYLISNYTTRQQ